MKHLLLGLSSLIILFTSACAAGLMAIPVGVVLEGASHESSSTTMVSQKKAEPQHTQTSAQQSPAPVHMSGYLPKLHVSGEELRPTQHLSGNTPAHHISGRYIY